jgi:hypothetical protein
MKKRTNFGAIFCLLFILSAAQFTDAADLKWLRYGNYQAKVASTGDMGEGGLGWAESGYIAYNGFDTFDEYDSEAVWASHAWFLGTPNWTDENGEEWAAKITGCGQWTSDELYTVMPVEDAQGFEIHKYVRYMPPTVTVDGAQVSESFPEDASEHVAPERIPGTAYAMLESWANTDMGVTLHQRVYNWNHDRHDDYLIYDWTFINTGNIDRDDEIELPNQVLDSLYLFRQERPLYEGNPWMSTYGESEGDTLRIMYAYPATSATASDDVFGAPHLGTGFSQDPMCKGAALLHADRSASDRLDWLQQPNMWAIVDCDLPPFVLAPRANVNYWPLIYETMRDGFLNYPNHFFDEYPGQWEGGHKSVRMDEMGMRDVSDFPYSFATFAVDWSVGPYTLAPGDSIRIVFALAVGSISPEKAWEVGTAWAAETADDQWPEAEWPGGDYGLPAQFDLLGLDANDLAKDAWVYTGRDTLFRNASYAQWSVQNDYNVPIPPPAPSVDVFSQPDKIKIEWGTESESVSDFAGYRVYRALGNPDPRLHVSELIGSWELIFECGEGTDNTLTHNYDDTSPERGQGYYYYVAAFDDGTENGPDAGNPLGGMSLESGKYMNRTTKAAFLTRAPGKALSDIRVVPNPYNYGAREIQFAGLEENKIMFLNIPPLCTIKIYTVSGDLVKTIDHNNLLDQSGDASWGTQPRGYSTTDTGQLMVSGVYIAYIKVTEDYHDPDTDDILYRKGESTTVKFVVVR